MDRLIESSIEHDLNPFIIFDSSAKVLKYNEEAEFLLSYIKPKEIFDLAMSCAPLSYGFKNSFINLEFNRVKYHAIGVGYLDDNMISVRLYKEIRSKEFSLKESDRTKVSIYTLLELACSSSIDISDKIVKKEYDPSIPEIYIRVKEFLSLLNASFEEFKNVKEFSVSVFVKLAETILINNKRYPICVIEIKSKEAQIEKKEFLKELSKQTNSLLYVDDNSISIEIAIISS